MNVVVQSRPKVVEHRVLVGLALVIIILLSISVSGYLFWLHIQALQHLVSLLESDDYREVRIFYSGNAYDFPSHLPFLRDSDKRKAEVLLDDWTRDYLDGRLNSEQLTTRIDILEDLGFYPGKADKYRRVAEAERLADQYAISQAIETIASALKRYPGDPLLLDCQKSYWNRLQQTVIYQGPVQHIFFHPLIAYPDRAFDGDAMSRGFYDYFVTVPEFNRIIEALYRNNYVLITYNDIVSFDPSSGRMTEMPLRLPADKKPLILSIDDMNYYPYMIQNGTAAKLAVDEKERVGAIYLDDSGQSKISYKDEIVPILDHFLLQHPDFSYQGAKGIIALTGYQGILGYRTNDPSAPGYAEEVKQARTLVRQLKAEGWSFASHGWGHLDTSRVSLPNLVADTSRWKAEVEALVGPSNIYVFPFGSRINPGDPRFQYLQQAGFKIFCSVGSKPYSIYGPNYLLMDRRHMDGIALCTQANLLGDLFDSEAVIDSIRKIK